MPMRRPTRDTSHSRLVPVDEFGWELPLILTLRHSTLPWQDELGPSLTIETTPLAKAREFGERDRLSLVAQYAAHQAFLRFAGIVDCAFDGEQWGIVRRRGSDCRLVRLRGATLSLEEDFAPLARIEELASFLAVRGLEPLERAWGKPESVYCAIDRRLRTTAGERNWLSAAAIGRVLSPDPGSLRSLLLGAPTFLYSDDSVLGVLLAASTLDRRFDMIALGGGSPLQRDSALAALASRIGPLATLNESEIVERLLERIASKRHLFVVRDAASLDDRARLVIHLLSGATEGSSWIVPADGVALLAASRAPLPLSETRTFILSERLVPVAELERVIESIERPDRARWLEDFVRSDDYRLFLEDGSVPEAPVSARIRQIGEPRRSYLAALGLIGESISDLTAASFLKQLGCKLDVDDLLVEGLTVRRDHGFDFASRSVQQCFANTIPVESRAGLCKLAATILEEEGDPFRCAALYDEAGERARGILLLESRLAEAVPPDLLQRLRDLPRELVAESPFLTHLLVDALLASGRYVEARVAAGRLAPDDRKFALARIERRLGNYAAAEEDLRAIENRRFDQEILLAEILRLEGKFEEAESRFQDAAPRSQSALDRVRLGYERALLALDLEETADASWISDATPAESYYSSRFRSYAAVDRGEYETAIREATRASEVAADLASRIDAELDLVYARFLAGAWEEARHVARRALALIEETEGDRAAGGVLFTLAFLCADSGQWTVASRAVDRLRRFYTLRGDARRSRELDLIAAQSALTRCAFDQAREIASTLLHERIPPEMREAAAAIVDEVDWIAGASTALRSTGRSACLELRLRHAMMRRRHGEKAEIAPGFSRTLAEWEAAVRSRKRATKPEPENRGEKLRLLRSLLALDRRSRGAFQNDIELLARECGVDIGSGRSEDEEGATELTVLRAAAIAAFPYGERDLGGARWRFVTRNRLGHFSEIGSLPPLAPRELDALPPEAMGDWVACSDSAWLFLEGLSRWPSPSREALASLVRVRSEHFNLKRISEQEELVVADAPPKSIEGILGSSPAIVDVVGLVVRLARTDVPICILGESGTGKELIARAIHRNSSRRSKAFTPVNCAALPENLIESELFGHVRGAFTGADRDRAGLIETTDGGTLFLDEIGELPPTAQAKLLRFLQEGEFRRVGDAATRTADVRLVAATNRKLEKAVDDGAFREDLYYRIRGVEVNVPPLRERGADIVLLARHFLARERDKQRFGPERFLPEVEAVFLAYRWPGNVRELQNAVRAAFAIAGDSRQVRLDHLPERLRGVVVTRAKSGGSLYDELNQFRKRLIERSLAESQGNQSQAAKRLGISRQALAYQIRELGILVT